MLPALAVKWYYVLVSYCIAPLLALPNSYGAGLTDNDNCSEYGVLPSDIRENLMSASLS